MMRHISIILIGALFGAGLALSGMLNPSKVAGFLDLFGTWDPSLAFVMGGGVVANFIGHRIVMRRPGPVFASGAAGFRIPANNAIDSKLVVRDRRCSALAGVLAGCVRGRRFRHCCWHRGMPCCSS